MATGSNRHSCHLMFPAENIANSGLVGKLSNNLNRNKKNRIDGCGFFAVAIVNGSGNFWIQLTLLVGDEHLLQ